jgi:bifunctional non-homologous end joining protein LigD
MTLRTYRAKRDFQKTPEPDAESPKQRRSVADASRKGGRFVVHRHRARRLHYDLRLEIGGVLASWAVPRGPSLDPAAKRLAVQVEDHPLGYIDFEGVIPAGQYGGGDVIVWDRGRWTPDPDQPDAQAALAAGELKVGLEGEKLHGGFVLIRTNGWKKADRTKPKWLLIHRRDEEAVPGWDADDHLLSVKTGRTNDDVAAGRRRPPVDRQSPGRHNTSSPMSGTTRTDTPASRSSRPNTAASRKAQP